MRILYKLKFGGWMVFEGGKHDTESRFIYEYQINWTSKKVMQCPSVQIHTH